MTSAPAWSGSGGVLNATYAIRFGEDHFVVRVADGRLDIERGDPLRPDAAIDTDARTFVALMTKRQDLKEAVRTGQVTLSGDPDAFKPSIQSGANTVAKRVSAVLDHPVVIEGTVPSLAAWCAPSE
jgi:SCP-2 sterol transfer family